MKNIKILILAIFLISTIANSQDRYPAQRSFVDKNGNPIHLTPVYNNQNTQFKQTEFIRGWQWGGNPFRLYQIL